jgi:tetratricopeptide (TPR) repeat protein
MNKAVFSKDLPFTFPIIHWSGWLLLVGFVFYLIVGVIAMLRPQMDERLYARYRNIPQADFLDGQDSLFPILKKACLAFNTKNYNKALSLFEQDSSAFFIPEKRLFSGICLLEQNQLEEASATFQEMKIMNLPPNYQMDANWYLALSHLRNHQRSLCENTLQEIVGEPRKTDAHRLMNILK